MNKPDYNRLMLDKISKNKGKRLLLHCCCAPCSSACLERLKDDLKVTVLFYNPNIEDGEYARRKTELMRFIAETGWADCVDCDREAEKFYSAVRGLEDEKEGGARCLKCFELRLEKTKEIADLLGYDLFTTTLTVSPLKNADAINAIGAKLGGEKWLCSDFKKRDGYLRSLQLSKEHGLYRQNYCGCVFSKRGENTK